MQPFLSPALALRVSLALFVLAEGPPPLLAQSKETAPAYSTPIQVLQLDGKAVDPFEVSKGSILVFVFLGNECPIANRYAPELRRIYDRFQPKGVHFWFVHPAKEESLLDIASHAQAFQTPGRVVADPTQILARFCGATITPEAAVFTSQGKLAYRGRIDDRFPSLNRHKPQAEVHDLQNALEDLLAKRQPAERSPGPAVGCRIQFHLTSP